MEWVVIGIVLALAMGLFGVPYALLFKPWRVKPLYRFLYVRSRLYRRWMAYRMRRSMRKITAAFGTLVPATKRAVAEMQKFVEALRKAGLLDA